jgi:acetoin utilization deacetylase AcuC-like enzyme
MDHGRQTTQAGAPCGLWSVVCGRLLGVLMIVYSTDAHAAHAPTQQIIGGRARHYPEVPERVDVIRCALEASSVVDEWREPGTIEREAIALVHDPDYVTFLETVYEDWVEARPGREGKVLIPDTFAMRGLRGRPSSSAFQAGYYCFETQTPITPGTWAATRGAAACALSGAETLLKGHGPVYALCRPPGHHASRDVYGGYCYLNHAAIAAAHLAQEMRTAVLDVDYHHGNGTQAIFYSSDAVMFTSIHGDPEWEYPHFSGYADETGEGPGLGSTRNVPLALGTTDSEYVAALDRELDHIALSKTEAIVLSLGVDTSGEDPLSKLAVTRDVFPVIGERIAALGIPTLVVQEGGYNLEYLGSDVCSVLEGYSAG